MLGLGLGFQSTRMRGSTVYICNGRKNLGIPFISSGEKSSRYVIQMSWSLCGKLVVFQHSHGGFCQVKTGGQKRMTILSVDAIQKIQIYEVVLEYQLVVQCSIFIVSDHSTASNGQSAAAGCHGLTASIQYPRDSMGPFPWRNTTRRGFNHGVFVDDFPPAF